MDDKIIIYAYTKVWNVEKKVYSIQNLNLPAPVNPYQMLYFFMTAFFILFLGKIAPVFNAIPVIIRFIALPYFLSSYLMKKKLDGKKPLKFFRDYLIYRIGYKSRYIERFCCYEDKEVKNVMNWNCSKGNLRRKGGEKNVSVPH